MRKVIEGIVEFRKTKLPAYAETFAKLALGQAPDALFVACSDSRVAANVFASTNPGDLFVVRNVGNMVPPCGAHATSTGDVSEAAAIEFALSNLPVTDIIVCGHSECGAMRGVAHPELITSPNLKLWLRHADPALERVKGGEVLDPRLSFENRISQVNVLQQIEHIRGYPVVAERVKAGKLRLHGWWFEIATASVYAFDQEARRFVLIDEKQAGQILRKLGE